MIEISVENKKGALISRHQFDQFPVQIGRSDQACLRLTGWGVQPLHCQLTLQASDIAVQLHPNSKALINEQLVADDHKIEPGDRLKIGGYYLSLFPLTAEPAAPKIANTPPPTKTIEAEWEESPDFSLQQDIHQQLLKTIDLRRIKIDQMDDQDLRVQIGQLIDDILTEMPKVTDPLVIARLKQDVLNETIGLGPLEGLLANPDVSEIMVNGCQNIFVESKGCLSRSDIRFSNNQALMSAIERIVLPLGRRIDEASPMVDARLTDGSRVNAIIPPLSLSGPCLTIRKFSQQTLGFDDLIRFGSVSPEMAQFLQLIVSKKQNVLISGGTGSGKTTLLNLMADAIPDGERIITIEDAAELQLGHNNLISLESRPANQEGKGLVSIRQLVKNSLRMRPDRIVVGECRGAEALDMLQAMNTGHDGSLSTAHANSTRDCLARLEVMVLMAGMDLPVKAIREQISSAINFVVQQTRFPCGARKITAISEVSGMEQDIIQLTDIFRFEQQGIDTHGKVQGCFKATGIIPEFVEQQRRMGFAIDLSMFGSQAF